MKNRLVYSGERLRVVLVGANDHAPPGPGEVRINQGAFGSGEHETTAMCLSLVEQQGNIGPTALDLGTGTGILAMAAARLGCTRVVAVDPSPGAIETCKRNLALNRLENRVFPVLGLLDSISPASAFHLVMANLYGHLLDELVVPLCRRLLPGGVMVLSGMLYGEDFAVRSMAEREGLLTKASLGGEEYIALALQRC